MGGGAGESGATGSDEAGAPGEGGAGGDSGNPAAEDAGAGGDAAGAKGDHEPPTIVSITPEKGAKKLTPTTDQIVITFSEPMNRAATEAAYAPAEGGTDATFSWNATSTELTIDPKLDYPAATDPNAAAEPFMFSVTTAAKDLAGNALAEGVDSEFTLLREITQTFPYSSASGGTYNDQIGLRSSVTLLVGDYSNNSASRGFLSYDISGLPNGIQEIENATLTANLITAVNNPFGNLGDLLIQSVSYSSLSQAAFDAPPLHELGVFLTGNHTTREIVTKDVLVALEDDYAHRAARKNLSQYRLQFVSGSNSDGVSDQAQFSGEPMTNKLVVRYVYP